MTKNTQFAVGYFKNLEPIIKDQKAEEIIFNLPLNTLTPEEMYSTIAYWKKLLLPDGILKVFFIDVRRVSNAIQTEAIQINDAHNLLFGPDYIHKSIVDCGTFTLLLKAVGLKADLCSLKDFFATFELKNTTNAKD